MTLGVTGCSKRSKYLAKIDFISLIWLYLPTEWKSEKFRLTVKSQQVNKDLGLRLNMLFTSNNPWQHTLEWVKIQPETHKKGFCSGGNIEKWWNSFSLSGWWPMLLILTDCNFCHNRSLIWPSDVIKLEILRFWPLLCKSGRISRSLESRWRFLKKMSSIGLYFLLDTFLIPKGDCFLSGPATYWLPLVFPVNQLFTMATQIQSHLF